MGAGDRSLWRARTTWVAAAIALGTVATGLGAAPSQAAVRPSSWGSTAAVSRGWAATQCGTGVSAAAKNDAALAAQIMRGRVAIEKYGTVTIPANPSWRPQAALDSSGDAHMHSLHYLLPLLREGVRTRNRAMTDRFYYLLYDWNRDNRLGMSHPPLAAAWTPLPTGYRLQVIACAMAGPRGSERWLRQMAAVNANYVRTYRSVLASNNTGLQMAMGQFAVGCAMRNSAWMASARSRMASLASSLILADGSTNEGAISYARSNYLWFQQAAARVRACHQTPPSALSRANRIPTFIAHAIRPDGRLESLGDTTSDLVRVADVAGTAAQFPASRGASGAPPRATFAVFAQSGYVFGRSGWGSRAPGARSFADQTFYSVRAGRGADGDVFHAHADGGAVTLYAHGAEQLADVGQWRYQKGPTREFVTGRAAHNAVSVAGATYSTRTAPRLVRAGSRATRDLVTVVDVGYAAQGVSLVRTVVYSRRGEYLLVWDRATSTKRDGRHRLVPRTFTQSWQLMPGTHVSVRNGAAATTVANGSGLSMRWLGSSPRLAVRTGASARWPGGCPPRTARCRRRRWCRQPAAAPRPRG